MQMKKLSKRISTLHESMKLWRHPFFRKSGAHRDDYEQYKHLINNCSVISSDRMFFYCRVPKAANSSIMATLVYADTGFKSADYQAMKVMRAKCYSRITESNISWEDALNIYFKFAIVRHPLSRIVSTFNDKALDASGYNETVRGRIKRYAHDARDVCVLFDEFIDRLETTAITTRNYHYAPQTNIMAFRPSELDYIGRVEALDEDLPHIMRRIYGHQPEIIKWAPHATRDGFKPRKKTMLIEMVSQKQKERLYKIYRADYELLGYERECP